MFARRMEMSFMVNQDLNTLFHLLLPHAVDGICSCGRFNPLCAAVGLDGDILPCVAKRCGKNPLTSRFVMMMNRKFQKDAQSGLVRAVGFCCSLRAVRDREHDLHAIVCSLEHQNGDALDAFLPYRLLHGESAIEFREVLVAKREPTYFSSPC